MSQDALERLLGRLITDESFRRCVSKNCLERMCLLEGYPLTASELRLANLLDLSALDGVALQLDPGMLRAARVSADRDGGCGERSNQEQCPLLSGKGAGQQEETYDGDNSGKGEHTTDGLRKTKTSKNDVV